MSDGVWKCNQCGYSTGRSWGQTSWTCPRCLGKPGYIEKLQKENVELKKKVKELEEELNPPYLGAGI